MSVSVNLVGLCVQTRRIIFWAIVSLMIGPLGAPFAGDAAGQSSTMADIALYMSSLKGLPDYCQCRLAEAKFRKEFRNQGQIDWPAPFAKLHNKWVRVFGNNWVHFHHYCFGIQKLNKAVRISGRFAERRRKATLEGAIGEFEYMRRRADRSFPLWPQLFMYKSQVYLKLGQPEMAQRAMQRAVEHQKRLKSRR